MRDFLERLIGILIWIAVILVMVLYIVPVIENKVTKYKSEDESTFVANWMKNLPDSSKLNELSIPGTHNSGTQYVELPFFSNCQTYSILEQLEMGYRYLDIRLAVDTDSSGNKKLKFTHGFTSCKEDIWPWSSNLYLDKVLEDCYSFLEKHPSETILFVVKQETGDESVKEFESLLNTYVSKNSSKWLLTDEYPTLAEARGKLVLFRRYEDEAKLGAKSGISLIWEDQKGRNTGDQTFEISEANGAKLYVQDHFEYGNNAKWMLFYYGLANPADTSLGEATISFLSTKGVLPYGHPFYHAVSLNKKLKELTLDYTTNYGWIVVDFGDRELAKKIYFSNYKADVN